MVMHAFLLLAVLLYGRVSGRPEQMHLSYAREPNSMWATWVVVGGHPAPPVSASTDQLCLLQEDHAHGGEGKEHIVRGVRASTYRENRTGCRSEGTYGEGCTPWNGTIYTAHFRGLVLHRTYAYTCGSASLGMTPSRRFTFLSSADPDIARTVTFAMFGDQGSFSSSNPNGGIPAFNDTYPGAKLVRDSLLAAGRPAGARGEEGGGGGGDGIQFLAVVGDVAYANGNQPVWDAYSRDMEPLWSTIPALVTPGNHDGEFTFGNPYEQRGPGGGDSGIAYALRFPGPGHTIRYTSRHTGSMSSTSLYWSRNEGPVHLIGLAGVLGFERGAAQYEWLEKDLREAAEPATRPPQHFQRDHTSLITNMSRLFEDQDSFNDDIEAWDIGSVTTTERMFHGATSFNKPLQMWDTSLVTSMAMMFCEASAFNQPIAAWDTCQVSNMERMFRGAASFDQPLATWSTGSVRQMSEMFCGASAFNQPLGRWDTSRVGDMLGMFKDASAFDRQSHAPWYKVGFEMLSLSNEELGVEELGIEELGIKELGIEELGVGK